MATAVVVAMKPNVIVLLIAVKLYAETAVAMVMRPSVIVLPIAVHRDVGTVVVLLVLKILALVRQTVLDHVVETISEKAVKYVMAVMIQSVQDCVTAIAHARKFLLLLIRQ